VLVRIVVLAVALGCPPAPEVANVITDWDAKAGKPQAIQRGAYRPLTTPLDRRTIGSGHLQVHLVINLVHLSASVVAGPLLRRRRQFQRFRKRLLAL